MLKFKPIPVNHQFTLFEYNEMRPKLKVPIKRISKERMEEAMKEYKEGKEKGLLNVLRDINDSLDVYCKRHNIK